MLETILNNFHLEKILWILQKRIAYIMILGVLGGMAGGAYAYLTNSTLYRAEVSFYVYSDPDYVYDSSVNISNSEFTQAKNLVQSYILILKSNTILQKVLEEAPCASLSQSQRQKMGECAVDAAKAAGYVNAGTIEFLLEPDGTEALSGRIGTSVVENTAVFYVYTYDSDPYRAMELANAIGRVAPKEIGRIVKSGGIEVIDYATLPEAPYSSTSLVKYALVGFAGCFGASFVLFLLAGLMDTTIRRRYELKLAFRIPVLGDIPQIQAPDRKSKPVLVLGENSSFAVKESYNTIRANLLFTGKGERCPVYAVTSADKDEGKTLNSVNIAISYAQLGKKVLLIDGDMRNMSVASLLKLRGRLGLSQYLAGLRETPQIVEYRQNLDVLVGGENPPNPSELLGGERMKELLTTLRSRYDCIIIDLPPVGIVTDALLLSHEVTAYLLVVRAGVSHMSREKAAVTLLEQVDADICGILFNGQPPKSKDCNYRLQQYWQEYKQQNGEAV